MNSFQSFSRESSKAASLPLPTGWDEQSASASRSALPCLSPRSREPGAPELPRRGSRAGSGLGQALWLPRSTPQTAQGNEFVFPKSRSWHLCQAKPHGGNRGRDVAQQKGDKTRIKVKKRQIFGVDPLQEGRTSPEPSKPQASSSPTCSLLPFGPMNRQTLEPGSAGRRPAGGTCASRGGGVTGSPTSHPCQSRVQSEASREQDVRFHTDTQHWQTNSHTIRARKCSSLEGPHL